MTNDEFLTFMREFYPAIYTIVQLNDKFLHDMEFGEIHIIEYIKNGKVWRVEATPTVSKILENADKLDK